MILFLFKPLDLKQQRFGDIPLFSISSFTMYEIDSKGLITMMNGEEGTRYSNRYSVKNIDYTDNSKRYIANMRSDSGIYKDNIVYLDGNVTYVREDGLTFKTQKAVFNKKTKIATAEGNFVLYRDANIVTGKELKYDSSKEKVESKNVMAIYQIEKRNK